MNNATMLYRCPGPHRTDGVDYDYAVVDAAEVGVKLAEGWHAHFLDAHAAAQADAARLAANEAEQAAIAQQLQAAQPAGKRKAKP